MLVSNVSNQYQYKKTIAIDQPKVPELWTLYSPTEIASQLTILDYTIFTHISEEELCCMGWEKRDDSKSPNVNAMVDRWNKTSMWISSEIVFGNSEKTKILKWIISVAEKLYELKNFHSLMSVIAGLNSLYVGRLAEMKGLGNKIKQRKLYLEAIMGTENNFNVYREKLKKSDGMVIPYLGLYMKDIFMILEDKQKSNPATGKYNWLKLRLLQQVLLQFSRFQKQECHLEDNVELQHSLCQLFVKSEQELDEYTTSKNLTNKEKKSF